MKYLLDGQETARLRLRLFKKDDLKIMEDMYKDPQDRTFLAMPREPSTKELMDLWWGYCTKRYKSDRGGENAMIDKKTGKLVGQCGLLVQDVNGVEELEVSYAILPQYRNLGYATEAARKLRNYAFEQAFADSLISIIHVDNSASENVARKNGMVNVASTELWNLPVHIYRINVEEWKKQQYNS